MPSGLCGELVDVPCSPLGHTREPLEEAALINGVQPGDSLPAGHTRKRVTGEVKPSP